MRGVFDDREIQQVEPRHDTELTLSSTTLLLIFFGLVLLCGLCFGLGYAKGRRGTQETAAALPGAGAAMAASQGESSRPKPSANAVTAQPSTAAGPQEPAGPAGANAAEESAGGAAASGSPAGVPQVKPALGNAATPVQPVQPAAAAVAPALSSGAAPATGSLMVQIAAVSQPEDANVLMSALRRRGYAVAWRREPLDGLIHVRIGPFKTRAEADGWRQKLLNDGYNAIVQP